MIRILDPSELGRPPETLAATADWFESMSYGLVLIEGYPLAGVRKAIDAFHGRMARHVADWPSVAPRSAGLSPVRAQLQRVVEADHVWFETSFEQIGWFFDIVKAEDHGGHRQALGQYGRLVSEAVRRHLSDEERLLRQESP